MVGERRAYKVAEGIKMALANILLQLSDPRLRLVTITGVQTNKDLSIARVYWMAGGGEERKAEVSEAFSSAAGLLRREVTHELGLRFAPELRFFYDDTLDVMARTNTLMQKVKDGE